MTTIYQAPSEILKAQESSTWNAPEAFREQLLEHYGLTCPPRWGTPRNFDRKTIGPKISRVMAKMGCPPMPWQAYYNDVIGEIDPDTGLLWYRNIWLSISRQQGKTESMKGKAAHRLQAWPRQNLIFTAQTRNDARARLLEDWAPSFEEAYPTIFKTVRGLGQEAIKTARGSSLNIIAVREDSGHGKTLDEGLIDEAFAHKDDRLEGAMAPAMITRPNAQLIICSAAGTDQSVYWNLKRSAGRRIVEEFWETGKETDTAYFEWYPQPGYDRTALDTWLQVMPALCPNPPCRCGKGQWRHTTNEETIRGELDRMADKPDLFDRSYLNVTRLPALPEDPHIPKASWKLLAAPSYVPPLLRPDVEVSLGVEVTEASTAIAVAAWIPGESGTGGRWYLELITQRAGVRWAPEAVAKLVRLWDPVAVGYNAKSPAAALADPLKELGVTMPEKREEPHRGALMPIGVEGMAIASEQLVDDVRAGDAIHIDQAQLTGALNGAITRYLGDAWLFAPRRSSADIAPLMAVTMARRAHVVRSPMIPRGENYNVLESVC